MNEIRHVMIDRVKKLMLSAVLIFMFVSAMPVYSSEISPELELLNEFTYYTTLIAQTKDRLYLDDIYDRLMNQYEPKNINEDIDARLTSMLNTIVNLKILDLKRERLQIVFDLQKANTIAAAVPNPVSMIGTIALSKDPLRSLAAAVGTAASSYTMYKAASADLQIEFNEAYWDLEYDEIRKVNELKTNSLSQQNSYANENNVAGEYIMNDENTTRFIDIISDDNISRAILGLESDEKTFRHFPLYWLERADLYFRNKNYEACIDTVLYYEKNFDYDQIYRRNERYGQVLIDVIESAIELYYLSDYEFCRELVLPWLVRAEENTAPDDWFQMYYISFCYLAFADDDHPEIYKSAYSLLQKCGSILSRTQDSFTSSYKAELTKKDNDEINKMTKTQKKEYEDEYKDKEKARDTELPPTDGGLVETLKLLYSINCAGFGDKKDYAHSIGSNIVVPQLREFLTGNENAEKEAYGFEQSRFSADKSLTGNTFTFSLPACLINTETAFYISVNNGGFHRLYNGSSLSKAESDQENVIKVEKVERHKSENIKDFDVKLKVKIPKVWIGKEEEDAANVTLRVDTAYCPIDIVFRGKKLTKLEFSGISKVYYLPGFFNGFK